MAERRKVLFYGGIGLVGLGAFMFLTQPKAPIPPGPPRPTPPPNPSKPPGSRLIQVGSAWLSRPGWVADHGNQAPLYGPDGSVQGFIAAGTQYQTLGTVTAGPEFWLGPNGPVCCAANGAKFPHWPVTGGFFNINDVTVVG